MISRNEASNAAQSNFPCRQVGGIFYPAALRLPAWKPMTIKETDPEKLKSILSSNITITERQCWEWQHAKPNNYASVRLQSGSICVHRLAYQLWKGPIPVGLILLHACDNPRCINPEHLTAGTHRDNALDRVAKGRNYTGTRRPIKPVRVAITVTQPVYDQLSSKVKVGLYGNSVAEVAERLLCESLRADMRRRKVNLFEGQQ